MKIHFLILAFYAGVYTDTQSVGLTVIGNPKGPPAQLRVSELRSIFLGERQRWRNGNKILIALMRPHTEVGKNTCEKLYDMTGDELKKFWLAQVFQGKAEAPVFFNTIAELQAFVAENPGAIGIIDQSPPLPSTVVILVDGKKQLYP
jgi:hypothetical protein